MIDLNTLDSAAPTATLGQRIPMGTAITPELLRVNRTRFERLVHADARDALRGTP